MYRMGCLSDNKTNNLEQGVLYRKREKKIKSSMGDTVNLLQKTSGPWGSESIEGFVGSATQIPLDKPLAGAGDTPIPSVPTKINVDFSESKEKFSKSIDKLIDEFNKTLSEYTVQYNLMADELIANNKQSILQKYANQNVKYNNNYYYVNEFGFAHGYDNDAWETRSVSCSKDAIEITSDDFKKLLGGPNMGKGQACGVAGFNVEEPTSGSNGWVDIKGVIHHYPTMDVWNNRNESCKMPSKTISKNEFSNIPKGSDMEESTFCERMNVDPKVLQSLANLNKKLIDLGNKLLTETDKLKGGNGKMDGKILDIQNTINNKLRQLQQLGQIDPNNDGVIKTGNGGSGIYFNNDDVNRTIESSTRDSELILRMNYLKYVIGLVIVIFLVIFSFNIFASDRVSTVTIIILVLLGIYTTYNMYNYIQLKLF